MAKRASRTARMIQILMRIRAAVRIRRYTEAKKAPAHPRLSRSWPLEESREQGAPDPRCYPKAQIRQGAEPSATGRVGADGETGDFKGLTLSNSGPVFLGSRGFFFRQGADRVSAPARRVSERLADTAVITWGAATRIRLSCLWRWPDLCTAARPVSAR